MYMYYIYITTNSLQAQQDSRRSSVRRPAAALHDMGSRATTSTVARCRAPGGSRSFGRLAAGARAHLAGAADAAWDLGDDEGTETESE